MYFIFISVLLFVLVLFYVHFCYRFTLFVLIRLYNLGYTYLAFFVPSCFCILSVLFYVYVYDKFINFIVSFLFNNVL